MSSDLFFRESGAGPPVVLVHAGVADGRMWEPQATALSGRYRVVIPDLRGFGRTPIPDHPFAHASDLQELAHHLGIGRAAWVGCSMGGSTVLDLALTTPDLVAALVLIDCVPSGYPVTDPVTRQGWSAAGEAFDAGNLNEAAGIEMEMWLVGPGRDRSEVSPELQDLVVTMILDSYRHGEGDESDPARPALPHLEEVACPSLVVSGAHDHVDFRRAADVMSDRIPKARRETITGAAHLPSMERPEVVNELLTGFLSQNYP